MTKSVSVSVSVAAWAAALAAMGGCATAPPPLALALPAVPAYYATRAAATAAPGAPGAHGAPGGAGGAGGAGVTDGVPAPVFDAAWWRVFDDPALNALVERAMQANPDIEAAAARLAQARAGLRGSDAAHAPQALLSAGANRQGGPLVNAAGASGTLLTLGASASYEIDLFGRWAQAHAAATLDAQAHAALLQAARLLVQADVAQAYFGLRALDAEGRAAQAGVQAWRDTLRLTEQRWQAGSLPEQAVLRLQAEVAASQAEAAALHRRRAVLQHALAVLLGEVASRFTLPEVVDGAGVSARVEGSEASTAAGPAATASDPRPGEPAVPMSRLPTLPQVPAGLPSQMLARRPDVAAAQQAWAAAQARAGEARAAWWPSLALTVSGGQASPGLADLLQAGTRAWGLGALLALPVFDGGRREAGVQQADAATQAAQARYRSQVLLAFKDVEDQLAALASLAEQAGWQAQAEAAAGRALVLARSRWRQGLASQLDLLEAQRAALRSRRLHLQVAAAQAQATVALIKALGGGWAAPGPG